MGFAALAPEAPAFAGILVSLLAISAGFVALGMIVLMDTTTKAVVGTLGHLLGDVPFVGRYLASPVNAVYHWMNHLFGSAELALDGLISYFMHSLGSLVQFMARELEGQARLLHLFAGVLAGTAGIDFVTRWVSIVERRIVGVERTALSAVHHIGRLEHSLTARIEGVVLPRFRTIERTIDVTIPHDIAGLRARTRGMLDRLDNLWHRVRRLDALVGTAAFAAAVAVALSHLGVSWIRCRNWKRVGRGVCSLPEKLLEAFLEGAIDVLVVADLCEIIELEARVFHEFEPFLTRFVSVVDGLVGCHGATKPAPLPLSTRALPVPAAPLALA